MRWERLLVFDLLHSLDVGDLFGDLLIGYKCLVRIGYREAGPAGAWRGSLHDLQGCEMMNLM